MRRTLVLVVAMALVGCSSPVSTPDVPELTVEYGCGYGFYVGSGDQTAGLFIQYEDFDGAANGDVVESAGLDKGEWSAELQTGADLFANWCDDVVEPNEPEPVVDETWTVTGRIEVDTLPPGGQCGPASASLAGLTAVNSDGEEITLGDIEVGNEFWGCFAG